MSEGCLKAYKMSEGCLTISKYQKNVWKHIIYQKDIWKTKTVATKYKLISGLYQYYYHKYTRIITTNILGLLPLLY